MVSVILFASLWILQAIQPCFSLPFPPSDRFHGDYNGLKEGHETTIPACGFYMHNYLVTNTGTGRVKRKVGRGKAMKGNMCDTVIPIPKEVKKSLELSDYYKKYTHAYGVPVISSGKVTDEAIKQACYVVRVMLADREDIRNSLYDNYGRVGIIGVRENTTDIPEHSFLDSYYDIRARGLGGTTYAPISTAGEENLLCLNWPNDPYHDEDILVHEFAHGIHRLGIELIDDDFTPQLMEVYEESVVKRGLWNSTYASVNFYEYFAKAVQCYFNVNGVQFLGLDNHVNTRRELKQYDRKLFDLVRQVFPCGNQLIDRCHNSECINNANVSKMCDEWYDWGECDRNPKYMITHCKSSCKTCDYGGYGQPGDRIRRNCAYRHPSLKADNTNKINIVKNNKKDKENANKITIQKNKKAKKKKQQKKLNALKKLEKKKKSKNKKLDIKNKTDPPKPKPTEKEETDLTTVAITTAITTVAITTAKPTTLPTTPLQTMDPGCQDIDMDCEHWAISGGCEQNPHMLLHMCPKSCDMCEAVKYCIDFYEECVDWAEYGQCYINPTFTWRFCRKSCNICRDCSDKDEHCPQWANAGQCESNSIMMHDMCPLSCGNCTQSPM